MKSVPPSAASPVSPGHEDRDLLADFTTDRRVLLLCLLAVPIGAIAALVAKMLLWLIAVFTNGAFFFRFSAAPVILAGQTLGWWGVLVPAVGGVAIGLIARY